MFKIMKNGFYNAHLSLNKSKGDNKYEDYDFILILQYQEPLISPNICVQRKIYFSYLVMCISFIFLILSHPLYFLALHSS